MQWTAKQIKAQLPQFLNFLSARGAEVLLPTNEWELCRFKSGNITSVIYFKKTGIISFYGDSHTAWLAFKNNTGWRANPATPRRKSRSPCIATLRERDGDGCFFCLEEVSEEDESEEHLVCVTHGGPNHIANKFLAHRLCNQNVGHLSALEKINIHVRAQLKKARNNGK